MINAGDACDHALAIESILSCDHFIPASNIVQFYFWPLIGAKVKNHARAQQRIMQVASGMSMSVKELTASLYVHAATIWSNQGEQLDAKYGLQRVLRDPI